MINTIVTDKGIEIDGIFLLPGQALRVHRAVADMGWCEDRDCPCFITGSDHAQDTRGEWGKPDPDF